MDELIKFQRESGHRNHAPATIRAVRYLYETEGVGPKDISRKTGIHENVVKNWAKKYKWIRSANADLLARTELQIRMARAEEIGIGELDQMLKTKELMDAQMSIKRVVPSISDPTRMVEVTEQLPDYKIQNEGLKRAMELTGTKIERKEVSHTGKQEIIHIYELPAKRNDA